MTGLARRIADTDWSAICAATADATCRVLAASPEQVRSRVSAGPATIDLDATDIEVYGRKKAGVAR